MSDAKVRFPFGAADVTALSATGAQAITIDNDLTILDGETVIATGARTLNFTVNEGVSIGALVVLKSKTTAVENTIFGTNAIGATFAGVAGKILTVQMMWDGTNFIEVSTPIQID